MPHSLLPRRHFLGSAALAMAGLAVAGPRLTLQEARKDTAKRPPNPFVYHFKIGEVEAFSISDVVHHHLLMLDNVGWTVAMDHDPETSVNTRKKLFAHMAENKSRTFGFHLP